MQSDGAAQSMAPSPCTHICYCGCKACTHSNSDSVASFFMVSFSVTF